MLTEISQIKILGLCQLSYPGRDIYITPYKKPPPGVTVSDLTSLSLIA